MKKVVIIPTYNERENIVRMIHRVMSDPLGFDLLIVDDGSPDGTADLVKIEQKEFTERLHILEREGKLGLGTAYIAGFKFALEHGYDRVFEMDCDFSHNPDDLTRLDAMLEDRDVAIGSRYSKGVNVVNWPIGRVLMSYYASAYVRTVLGIKLRDTTAGFVCWTRKVLETMSLDDVRFKGYAFQIEMKYTALRLGFKIKEVPVVFVNRELGTSKMSGGIFSEALFGVMRLRMTNFKRRKA